MEGGVSGLEGFTCIGWRGLGLILLVESQSLPASVSGRSFSRLQRIYEGGGEAA